MAPNVRPTYIRCAFVFSTFCMTAPFGPSKRRSQSWPTRRLRVLVKHPKKAKNSLMQERGSILEFGPFRLNLSRRSLERDGQPIALSGKALEILAFLLERRGEVVEKNDLMRRVWPDTIVEESNITVAISALRKALEGTPTAKWIATIPGRGYSFVGLAASQPLRSVAILEFNVLNQDGRNEYFGVGLTDAVITRLSNTPLIVRPLASVSRFAGQDPIQTGRDLGVDAVLVGSIRAADDLIRVSVHLLRVRDSQS